MQPAQVPFLRILALFILTGLLVWFMPIPNTQMPSSIVSKMSR